MDEGEASLPRTMTQRFHLAEGRNQRKQQEFTNGRIDQVVAQKTSYTVSQLLCKDYGYAGPAHKK